MECNTLIDDDRQVSILDDDRQILQINEYLLNKAIMTSGIHIPEEMKKELFGHWIKEALFISEHHKHISIEEMCFESCATCPFKNRRQETMGIIELKNYHKAFFWLSFLILIFGIGMLVVSFFSVYIRWQTGMMLILGGLSWLIPISYMINKIMENK